MKVLIIGGMGVIGGAITEVASRKEIDVYVLSRRPPFEQWIDLPVHYIKGNWKDDLFASELVSEFFDVIVDTQIFNEQQLSRSAKIVNGHCTQFIYISTDSVYKHPNTELEEDDDIKLDDLKWKYGYDKRKAELYLLDHSSEYSFYWTIIRPTITFGNTRIPVGFSSKRNTYTMVERIIAKKPILRFDDFESKHALCHKSIFGQAVCELFLHTSSAYNAFHISDDISYKYDDIFHVIEEYVGEKAIFVHMDSRVVKKYNKSIYEEMIYDKNSTFTLNNKKIKSICHDLSFHVSIKEAIFSTLEYLKDHTDKVEQDNDYNLLTDIILLKSFRKIEDENERKIVRNYVQGLSESYKRTLRLYDRKNSVRNIIQFGKFVLRPIKRLIVRKKT